jgi:hypothetical protein
MKDVQDQNRTLITHLLIGSLAVHYPQDDVENMIPVAAVVDGMLYLRMMMKGAGRL